MSRYLGLEGRAEARAVAEKELLAARRPFLDLLRLRPAPKPVFSPAAEWLPPTPNFIDVSWVRSPTHPSALFHPIGQTGVITDWDPGTTTDVQEIVRVEPAPVTVNARVQVGQERVSFPRGRRVEFPLFDISDCPQIRLSDIRERRFRPPGFEWLKPGVWMTNGQTFGYVIDDRGNEVTFAPWRAYQDVVLTWPEVRDNWAPIDPPELPSRWERAIAA
jgi:hypothetical protein